MLSKVLEPMKVPIPGIRGVVDRLLQLGASSGGGIRPVTCEAVAQIK
jgi:hypothetical protein